jgi:hypothetical protein
MRAAAENYLNDYDDDEPDYAVRFICRGRYCCSSSYNAEAPRAGRVKVIGVKVDLEVVVGISVIEGENEGAGPKELAQ